MSSGGDIWINLAEDEGKLRVFRNGEGSPETVDTDDKDFDAFGLSDDGTKAEQQYVLIASLIQ